MKAGLDSGNSFVLHSANNSTNLRINCFTPTWLGNSRAQLSCEELLGRI